MTTTFELDDLRAALLELAPTQQVAVEALAGGATRQEAAEAAGVTRETVTRWAGHVPVFKATLNLYRTAIINEQIDTADASVARPWPLSRSPSTKGRSTHSPSSEWSQTRTR